MTHPRMVVADIPCAHVKSHYLRGTLRVHSIRLVQPGGHEYALIIPDKAFIDPNLVRVEVIHYTAKTTLVRIEDHKKNFHQFWVANERKTS